MTATATALPERAEAFLRHLRSLTAASGGRATWSVVAMMKADLMNARDEWSPVSVAALHDELARRGWTDDDRRSVCDLVRRAQEGRRLVPAPLYRDYRFDVASAEDRIGNAPINGTSCRTMRS
jgi:hypothetical protein